MSDAMVLGFKLGIGIISLLLAFLLLTRKRLFDCSNPDFFRLAMAFTIASRLSVFSGYFLVLGMAPRSDVTYYYLQAKKVLAGLSPYRDFENAYGPLFPRMVSFVVELWHSAEAIILLSILFEVAAVALWLLAARKAFPRRVTRVATILYLTNPLPLTNVAINGQNQVWVSAFLALSVWLLFHKRDAFSGLALGASFVFVKLLGAPFVPIILFRARKRITWLMTFMVSWIPFYAYLLIRGVNPLMVLTDIRIISSGNLPFLMSIFGIDPDTRFLYPGLLILVLLVTVAWAIRRAFDDSWVVYAIALVMMIFMAFSPKSYADYLVVALFPLCLTITPKISGRGVVLFVLFGTLAILEPSLWERWVGVRDLAFVSRAGITPRVAVFVLIDIVLVGLYFWYGRQAWSRLARRSKEGSAPSASVGP